jgi:hypothetical protein
MIENIVGKMIEVVKKLLEWFKMVTMFIWIGSKKWPGIVEKLVDRNRNF